MTGPTQLSAYQAAQLAGIKVTDCEFSVVTLNAIQRWRSNATLADLHHQTDGALLTIPRFGQKALREVRSMIETVLSPPPRTYSHDEVSAILAAAYPLSEDRAIDLFLAEVRAELTRARGLFPGDRIMTIALAEEFGELCKAVLDEPAERVRKEAVQTCVMAARVVLDGDSSVNEWRATKGLDPLTDAGRAP